MRMSPYWRGADGIGNRVFLQNKHMTTRLVIQ